MEKVYGFFLGVFFSISLLNAQVIETPEYKIFTFGFNGQVNTTYDTRQRPNCVLVDKTLFLVYNGYGSGKADDFNTKAMAVTFDMQSETFSNDVMLGPATKDHHNSPVIWVDMEDYLHVFHGWHGDLGKHLVSKEKLSIGTSLTDWTDQTAVPSQKMSYQWLKRIYDNKQLVVYRTAGHISSWTYRISSDDGITWDGPENDVVDLDLLKGMTADWSTYHAKAVSKDGYYLYLAFHAYDDYKNLVTHEEIASGKKDKSREYNPLYDNRRVSYNYNLYLVKIDLRTHVVTNFNGDTLETPIDLAHADECMIWDTEWRGGSIVPSILLDENDQPGFLHNISNYQHEDSLDYHYYRLVEGAWKDTRITHSNHEWNSSWISEDEDGTIHAFLITGEGYLEEEGYMDKHGGGRIEEWISTDQGNTWELYRDITPDPDLYPGWKFNNIQPVKRPDGSLVNGMLVFYGWNESDRTSGKGFLFIEQDIATAANKDLRPKGSLEVYPNPAGAILNVSHDDKSLNTLATYHLNAE